MPGNTVATILPQVRKAGNSPAPHVWHSTAGSNAPMKPPLPHGLTPWIGAHPQSTLQTYPQRAK